MRKLALSVIVAFAFYVTAAVAQSGNMGGSNQGSQGSAPSAQPGQTQPGQPGGPDMGPSTGATSEQHGTANNNTGDHSQGEKKLKGCVQSQGGQYVLESKHGKAVMLTGQDLSAHVGHEVKVKGTWESGNASGMSSSSTSTSSTSGNNAGGEKTFNVTNVEMVSDSCKGSSKNNNSGSNSGMGAGSTGSSTGTGTNDSTGGSGSTGTGTGTGNTGSGSSGTGTGNGTGSTTTPPQQ